LARETLPTQAGTVRDDESARARLLSGRRPSRGAAYLGYAAILAPGDGAGSGCAGTVEVVLEAGPEVATAHSSAAANR
jgi:hypothetical protein